MNTYRATNTLNGKFYIGSTKNFEYRKSQHLRSKENYPFQNDLRKNPEAFVWEVYTDNLDTNEHEVRLLREFFFDVKCYNINSCAERPPSQTGKTQWKNELTQKQTVCFEKPEGKGWEKGMLQKAKKKMSVVKSGENHPQYGRTGALNPSSKAMIATEPDGTQRHFGSIHEAARNLKMDDGELSRYARSGHVLTQGPRKGWRFAYGNQ